MKLSFVIPAYNEEQLLPLCLSSIISEIKRSGADAEIVVVNNASTDRTAELAREFPGVIVVDESRKGLTWARQAGFQASRGALIANVDADTMLPPGWISTVVHKFESNERLVALSGPFIYYDLPAWQRALTFAFYRGGYVLYLFIYYVLRCGAMLQGGNFILRRSALERIGGFDTSIAFYGEDTDIARRMSAIGNVTWTFSLPILASGRRITEEGLFTMGVKYVINFLWTNFRHKPFTEEYVDVRPSAVSRSQ